jgi:hypothetical protein
LEQTDEMEGEGTTFNEGAPEIAESELEYDVNDKRSLLGEGSFGSVYKVRKKGRLPESRKKKARGVRVCASFAWC